MRRDVTLLLLIALTGACARPGDGPPPAASSPLRVLPAADTGRIDTDALEGRIAFSGVAGSEEIFVADADGSDVRRLTHDDHADFDPTWSPDGSRVAFRSQRDGNDEIFLLNADGSGARNLTRNPAADWGPDWSPDGSLIAFNSGRVSPTQLHGFVMEPSGLEVRQLNDEFVEYPAWSPDGREIAFMHQTFDRPGGNYDIYVMDADGSNVRRLTESPADDGWPTWSPDGRRIAFTSVRDDCSISTAPDCATTGDIGEFHTLYVMNADGSDERRITDVFGQFSVWSPDGEHILFAPAPGGVYVVRPDGSDLTLLPLEPAVEHGMVDWIA